MLIKLIKSSTARVFTRTQSTAKILTALTLSSLLAACEGGLGVLLSAPKVVDADNDQVVFIGDSIYALSGEIQENLESYAGETFRNYAISGAQLIGGSLATPIPDQLLDAIDDNANIDTVVMDGGGNDILLPAIAFDPNNCKTNWYEFGRLSKSCRDFIDNLYVEGVNLLNDFAGYGIDNIIYLGYYYTKNSIFGNLDDLEEAVDYGDTTLKRACDVSPVPCEFVDPRSTIVDSDVLFDGIHPNSSGSKKIADLMWPALQRAL